MSIEDNGTEVANKTVVKSDGDVMPGTDASKKAEPKPLVSGFLDSATYQLVDPTDYHGKPFEVDGAVVAALKLRKPRPMELSGLDIQSIGTGDVNTVVELMSRCSSPSLTAEQVNDLDLSVVTEATGAFKSFLLGMTSGT